MGYGQDTDYPRRASLRRYQRNMASKLRSARCDRSHVERRGRVRDGARNWVGRVTDRDDQSLKCVAAHTRRRGQFERVGLRIEEEDRGGLQAGALYYRLHD